MFMTIVFILLMLLLIVSSGAALHMGIFHAQHRETGFLQKALGGLVSYGLSAVIWLYFYSYHYLQW